MKKKQAPQQPLIRFLFLLYSALMLWLLFGRSQGWTDELSYWEMLRRNVNLVPLLTIRNYWYVILHRTNDSVLLHCIINLAGNVIMFIPIGYLLPKLWYPMRRFGPFFVTCTGLIFCVETLQLFTLLGSFDVDDLILNLIGMTAGYLFYLSRKK